MFSGSYPVGSEKGMYLEQELVVEGMVRFDWTWRLGQLG